MIKLYGGKRSRASIVQWYLEELGLGYEFVLLDMEAKEHRQPEYLAINPMGKVPAIVDGDLTLWESGAILLYLADQYGPRPLTPTSRAQLSQWILFANATLGPGIFVESSRQTEMPKLMPPVDAHLQTHDYLVGEDLTVADVALGSFLFFMPIMLQLDLSEYAAIQAYVQRLSQRPPFQKTMMGR